MKTIVACVLGLAAFAISFAGGGSRVYADAIETASSALQILAPAAGTTVIEALDQRHCVLYSDGADDCVVNVPFEAFDRQSTAVSEIDRPATEPAAVRFVDAIPVGVVQTMTIVAPGFNARETEETAYAPPLPMPATEPVLGADAKTTTGALTPPNGQSAEAIAAAIIQSTTVAAPGESARDTEQAAQAEAISDRTAPISTRRPKAAALDDE